MAVSRVTIDQWNAAMKNQDVTHNPFSDGGVHHWERVKECPRLNTAVDTAFDKLGWECNACRHAIRGLIRLRGEVNDYHDHASLVCLFKDPDALELDEKCKNFIKEIQRIGQEYSNQPIDATCTMSTWPLYLPDTGGFCHFVPTHLGVQQTSKSVFNGMMFDQLNRQIQPQFNRMFRMLELDKVKKAMRDPRNLSMVVSPVDGDSDAHAHVRRTYQAAFEYLQGVANCESGKMRNIIACMTGSSGRDTSSKGAIVVHHKNVAKAIEILEMIVNDEFTKSTVNSRLDTYMKSPLGMVRTTENETKTRSTVITLYWAGVSDMDLSLETPDGKIVYYMDRYIQQENGACARLALDTNAEKEKGKSTNRPMEIITCDKDFILDGCKVYVDLFDDRRKGYKKGAPYPFTVTVDSPGVTVDSPGHSFVHNGSYILDKSKANANPDVEQVPYERCDPRHVLTFRGGNIEVVTQTTSA
jgi:hypothetical protein